MEFLKGLLVAFLGMTPSVGDVYVLRTTAKNPWDRLEQKVIEVKNGYIKYEKYPPYRHCNSFSTNSKFDFNLIYKKVK